jgi:hypothetical protein
VAIGGTGITPGQGKGGAIFVMTEEMKSQAGVSQMPHVIFLGQLPEFTDNFASNASNRATDNADVYGAVYGIGSSR